MRRTARRTLLPALALVVLLVPSGAQAGSGLPTVEVASDPVGDWGGGGDNALIGHVASQDLIGASVGMSDGDTVDFTMKVTFLPSLGGMPEATRYTWNVGVVSRDPADPSTYGAPKLVEFDGKFTNYTRGACDPTSGQCPPPRDPGPQPFVVRGDCVADPNTNITTCRELGLVQAQFVPFAGEIRIPVPTSLMPKLSPCSRIVPAANLFGGSISAAPSAFVTSSVMPMDTMEMTGELVVPSDDPVNNPCPEYVGEF